MTSNLFEHENDKNTFVQFLLGSIESVEQNFDLTSDDAIESNEEKTDFNELRSLINLSKLALLNKRRSESAEKYFNWIRKTQRQFVFSLFSIEKNDLSFFFLGPVEYFRGRRFWLFTKKDETSSNSHLRPASSESKPNSINHGLWRSGIVGRR